LSQFPAVEKFSPVTPAYFSISSNVGGEFFPYYNNKTRTLHHFFIVSSWVCFRIRLRSDNKCDTLEYFFY